MTLTDDAAAPVVSPRLVRGLTAVIVVAVLAVAVAAGWFWGDRSSDLAVATPGVNSVDAGFARDMSVHHRQAVTMSQYEELDGSSPAAKLFAYDIDASQSVQLGQMLGWLDGWGLEPTGGTAMSWMGAHMASMVVDGLMPGMANSTQMTALRDARGTASDVLFLQLMINHHLGGVTMARYAADNATEPYVRSLAQKMVDLQSSEIVQMEQTLRQLGGAPLPPPVTS